jgi:hypothetical protein
VQQPIDEHLITDYLLGALSETDTERLDKMSLTDGEFADRLIVAEDDLVDAYARGELSGDLLDRFTSHYLASARSREKVKVAASFLLFADKAATTSALDSGAITRASPIPDGTVMRKAARPGFFAMPHLALQWGFAVAALVFLVAGAYLVYENLRLRREMTQTKTERTTLEQREQELHRQLAAQRLADTDTEQQLAQVRERLAQLEQQQQPNVRPRDQNVIAFNLAPPTRGGGQVATLTLPEQVDSVALTLESEATGFASYRVALKNTATGQIVWQSGRVKSDAKGRLRVNVPGNLLKPQNYVLELSGLAGNGAAERVGIYPVRVVQR